MLFNVIICTENILLLGVHSSTYFHLCTQQSWCTTQCKPYTVRSENHEETRFTDSTREAFDVVYTRVRVHVYKLVYTCVHMKKCKCVNTLLRTHQSCCVRTKAVNYTA